MNLGLAWWLSLPLFIVGLGLVFVVVGGWLKQNDEHWGRHYIWFLVLVCVLSVRIGVFV